MAVRERKIVQADITTLNNLNYEQLIQALDKLGVTYKFITIEQVTSDPDCEDWDGDDRDYHTLVSQTLKDVWNNGEDDVYNDV